jgi:toxin ParE1/3/4
VTGIRYTADAVRDLEEIYRYIAEDNIDAAIEHRQRLKRRCLGLIDHPRIGRKREEIKPGLRSVTEGDYVLLYRIAEDEVVISRVIHGKQDLRKLSFPE